MSWPRDDAEDGDHRHGEPGDQAEHLGHAVEFALQRRAGALGGRDHAGDLAHLRSPAPVAVTTNVAVPRVTWVFWNTRFVRSPSATSPVGQGHPVLGHRRALAGERGLLHLERGRGEDPAVGRDDVTRLEQHDVAGHELRSIRSPRPGRIAAPGPAGTWSCASASTLARAFSSWFVPMTTLNVTSAQHHDAGRHLPDGEAGHADDQQHDVHRVGQLAPRDHPDGSAAARSAARWARTRPAGAVPRRRPAPDQGRHPSPGPRPPPTGRTRRRPRRAAWWWSLSAPLRT